MPSGKRTGLEKRRQGCLYCSEPVEPYMVDQCDFKIQGQLVNIFPEK